MQRSQHPSGLRLLLPGALLVAAWSCGSEPPLEPQRDAGLTVARRFAELGPAAPTDQYLFFERLRIEAPAREDRGGLPQSLDVAARSDDGAAELPGSGALTTRVGDEDVPLPLERTDVVIDVVGPLAVGAVRQRFTNPYEHPIEAVYVFPLPHDAAVHDFVLTIGERRIRGVVREREEARELYEAARAQGYAASLLSQERPNVFTQSVANLAPGHGIDVELAYLEPVVHDDGWQELAFPLVVGPRYNPVGWERGIGAVPAGAGGVSGQPTEVPYARPGQRSAHDVSIEVSLRPGLPLERVVSPSHAITVEERPDRAVVRLAAADVLPNADFRLRWRVAHEGLAASLVRQGGHALLTVYPPDGLAQLPRRPVEHVFVLDTSGSMRGEPLRVVKAALRAAFTQMSPADTFHLLHFGSSVGALAPDPLTATEAHLARAARWVDALEADGGTEMLAALRAALTRRSDGERPRIVTFLTDGFIGNEEELFAEIQRRTADVRVFAVGIGSSPNRWLLAELAARSGGADAVIGLGDDPGPVVRGVFDRACRPALQDLRLEWRGARGVASVALPSEVLVGRPLVLPFALEGADAAPVSVTISGSVGRARRVLGPVAATVCDDLGVQALAKVWARGRLSQLAAEARVADAERAQELVRRMTELALEHGLVSSFTSFLAVDSAQRVTDGGDPRRVDVAVPVPAGVEFEAAVGGG